ncbi:MAG: TIGR00730 family Rossman fold protein, partial [Gammaproteobacteria bacterium]|nr:TIGR00730 family Rossman fold protein [Gammaproteobacteria bacterium]
FIILPGGYGTFDEFFEIVTWAQIGIHRKPIGLLNIDGYYDPLLQMVQKASYHGFIYPGHDTLFVSDPTPAMILPALEQYKSPKDLK